MTTIPLLSIAILVVLPMSYAQQLNQVRAYIAPAETQPSYFPSEQQIRQALEPQAVASVVQPSSSFPPLVKQPQVFVNQFSTPDAPRLKIVRQFVAPNGMTKTSVMPRKYNLPNKDYFSQNRAMFSVMPRPTPRAMNNFPQQRPSIKSWGSQSPTHLGAVNTNSLSTLPFGHHTVGNKFLAIPKNNNNRKKAGDETMKAPRNLGRMPSGWRFPYISKPDPVTNQFPPIVEEAGGMVDASKWDVFNGY